MSYKNNYYILDTSALMFDPTALTYFTEGNIYIPVSVLEELDKHKDRLDEVGVNARTVNRRLHDLKKLGNLNIGVIDPESKVKIKVIAENLKDVPPSLDQNLNDNRILSVCLTLAQSKGKKNKIHLVTNDLNLGLKAEAYGIKSFEFQPECKYTRTDYKGYREIEESEDLIIEDIYKNKKIECPARLEAIENEHFIIKNKTSKQSILTTYRKGFLYKMEEIKCYNNIKPLNNEQKFAMSLLLNPNIKLVTLTGLAGSGKTLLSVACGLYQCIEPKNKEYEKLVISRSLVLLSGKDKLGFLKGSLKEKLDPYMLPLKDAVDQVLGDDAEGFEYLTASMNTDSNKKIAPKIEIEPLQYIRGRSLRNIYFIIDESQNLSLAEVKSIVSRAGENCKVVLLGDTHQIDNPYLSKYTNGLAQVIERFKGSEIAGHVALREGVRSQLATESANRL